MHRYNVEWELATQRICIERPLKDQDRAHQSEISEYQREPPMDFN